MRRRPLRLIIRASEGAGVLLVVSFLTFFLAGSARGDVAVSIAQRREGGAPPTKSQVDQIRRELHLDGSLLQRYGRWLGDALHGDFGISLRTNRRVASEVAGRIGPTLELAGLAAVVTIAGGLLLGVAAALRRRTVAGFVARSAALLTVSAPSFVVAYIGVLVFGLELRWLPTVGQDGWRSYILPAATLALPAMGALSRVAAVSLDATFDEPYITTARARGESIAQLTRWHALPNALVPTITVAGTQIGQLVAGTLVVEAIFAWPGLGSYFLDAVKFRDPAPLQASVVVLAAGFLAAQAIATISAAALDPRLRADH